MLSSGKYRPCLHSFISRVSNPDRVPAAFQPASPVRRTETRRLCFSLLIRSQHRRSDGSLHLVIRGLMYGSSSPFMWFDFSTHSPAVLAAGLNTLVMGTGGDWHWSSGKHFMWGQMCAAVPWASLMLIRTRPDAAPRVHPES